MPGKGEQVCEDIERALASMPLALDRDTPLAVAFSGGLDSSVLLAALVRAGFASRLRALHIDHGLHESSRAWARHCERVAAGHGVAFESQRIDIDAGAGASLEARARAARYAALESMMRPGEWLATAHQSEDQLETLLLHLVRGAGVRGMRGIADFDTCGPGYRVRPLLGCARADLEAAAREWGLVWIEDPSNVDTVHDRNFLRARVVPALTARWPSAAAAAVRQAGHMRDAERLLAALARIDADTIEDPGRIDLELLAKLEPERQRNLLRHVIRLLGLPLPDAARLETLREGASALHPDAPTCVAWPGAEARVYRGRLYLLAPLPALELPPNAVLGRAPFSNAAAGTLALVRGARGLPDEWVEDGLEIGFRRGGERFTPREGAPSRTLKDFLREAGIVPWMRDRIPLLRHAGRVVAIGDIWLAEAANAGQRSAWRVSWEGHPRLR